jgi:hypothetical protein
VNLKLDLRGISTDTNPVIGFIDDNCGAIYLKVCEDEGPTPTVVKVGHDTS